MENAKNYSMTQQVMTDEVQVKDLQKMVNKKSKYKHSDLMCIAQLLYITFMTYVVFIRFADFEHTIAAFIGALIMNIGFNKKDKILYISGIVLFAIMLL